MAGFKEDFEKLQAQRPVVVGQFVGVPFSVNGKKFQILSLKKEGLLKVATGKQEATEEEKQLILETISKRIAEAEKRETTRLKKEWEEKEKAKAKNQLFEQLQEETRNGNPNSYRPLD